MPSQFGEGAPNDNALFSIIKRNQLKMLEIKC